MLGWILSKNRLAETASVSHDCLLSMDQGVPDLHHADYLIDFQWDENVLEVCDSDFFKNLFILFPGKNATLLIHEATLEDGLEEEAVEKRHRWVK